MIFIPGEVPSSKNSKIKSKHGVFSSVAVKKYLRFLGVKKYSCRSGVEGYKKRPNIFDTPELRSEFRGCEYPVVLGVHFVRRTKGKFDFINIVQIIADLLVAHRVIEDDDINHLIPVCMTIDGQNYHVDKHKPGVYLQILDDFRLPSWDSWETRRQ